MQLLISSLAALAIGPVLFQWSRSRPSILQWLEGFVVAAIASLVLIEILPEAWVVSGWPALVWFSIGLLIPPVGERAMRSIAQTHAVTVGLALVGVVGHALLDGATLAVSDNHGLPIAVILHRLPVGLMVWWLLIPRVFLAVTVIGLAMVATLTGYAAAPQLAAGLPIGAIGHAQSVIAGMLLHVLFHRHPDDDHLGDRRHHHHSLREEFTHWLTPPRTIGMAVGISSILIHRIAGG